LDAKLVTEQNEPALRQCLERILPRVSNRQSDIAAIHSRQSDTSTSYETDILTVQLADGGAFKVFLKNYGVFKRPKDEMGQRRAREVRVYQDLLEYVNLGTPRYYGTVWDESQETFWLLLEYVDGIEVRDLESNYWIAAAGWLGQMHGYFTRHAHYLSRLDFLIRHDVHFLSAKADAALDAVSQILPGSIDRFAKILNRYDRVVEAMVVHPPTLIHGAFRPQNVMVSGESRSMRICAYDWEEAAFGAPLYDLAYLSDGFKPPTLDLMFGMYRQGATRFGMSVPEQEEMRYVVDCFRLHMIVNLLAQARVKQYGESNIAKLLVQGEERLHLVDSAPPT
jgi:aminoglycoside phosphotransferase (APT) family kinase protein